MNKKLDWLIGIVNVCCIICAICVVVLWLRKGPSIRESIIHDTIVKIDTIIVEKPVAKDSIVLRTEKVYVDKFQVDTLRDTLFIEIPFTQKKYETASYRAYVSGYKPSLDSFYIYNRETIVNRTKKPNRWSIGLSGGYGITPKGFQPYLGVSLNYRLK